MANKHKTGPGPKILGLILLILIFSVGGSLWFDYLGIVDVSSVYAPIFRLVGLETRSGAVPADDPNLLEGMRFRKEREALEIRERELELREEELDEMEEELARQRSEIEERESLLAERENSFNQKVTRYDNRRENLIQNARDLNSMRLENAVGILRSYDDQLLIDTLRVAEELAREEGEMSLVSVWLSEFPPERAADIQRKMTIRPGG